jgi:hypothetical protein
MLAYVSIVPILLVIAWLVAEARCQRRTRVIAGFAALIFVGIVAFLWGGFAEALQKMQFPEPHDSPADTAIMDAADKATNKISK